MRSLAFFHIFHFGFFTYQQQTPLNEPQKTCKLFFSSLRTSLEKHGSPYSDKRGFKNQQLIRTCPSNIGTNIAFLKTSHGTLKGPDTSAVKLAYLIYQRYDYVSSFFLTRFFYMLNNWYYQFAKAVV
jgi:hypothetical protein